MVQKHQKNVILVVLAAVIAALLAIAFYLEAGAFSPNDYGVGPLRVTEVGWAGTAASTADEWYEVHNGGDGAVDTSAWYLMTIQGDGDVVTATMPITSIQPGDYVLFERTDDTTIATVPADGIHGGTGSGGSLVGIFANDDVISFGIYDGAGGNMHIITMTAELRWPAGSSSPNASMQWLDGAWLTSNSGTELDAEGNVVFGTPGSANIPPIPNPVTCATLPDNYEWDLDLILFEDMSTQGQIQIDAILWGFDSEGTLSESAGAFTIIYANDSWHVGEISYDPETSSDCVIALENLRDATATVLSGDSSPLLPGGGVYATWLRGVLEFQRSGLFATHLPVVVSP